MLYLQCCPLAEASSSKEGILEVTAEPELSQTPTADTRPDRCQWYKKPNDAAEEKSLGTVHGFDH